MLREVGHAVNSALDTVNIEIAALQELAGALGGEDLRCAFNRTATLVARAKGRLIVTGMGKSGHIGRKIAATLASTGTPSIYIHPAEASHGDLGMIAADDVVLALSWSGETAELRDLILYCRRFGVPLIVMTSRQESAAGRAADICLTLPRVQEACPNRLAPTSSTTVQLALGDALAVALIELRGFSASDFRTYHPGGKLAAQLMTVDEIMGDGEDVPRVTLDCTLLDATFEMSRKRYGTTAVVDDAGRLVGAFTDGDLRRSIPGADLQDRVRNHMTPDPIAIAPDTLASEALRIMNENSISVLFVCHDTRLAGIVHIHDLLRTGVA